MPQYKVNDQVRYKPVGGPQSNTSETTGVIKEVLTASGNLTGRQVHASPQSPRYEIRNRSKMTTPTNGPRSRKPTLLNTVPDLARPRPTFYSGWTWATWMSPARGEEETYDHDEKARYLCVESNDLTMLELETCLCVESECGGGLGEGDL
ncbi:hypothetical protein UA08_01665 [Talaromyces atroroseus]|uniref:Hypervirulence associated protein TUDOR domain-containing protein n=1 Tax=Talaromyces atroroseus TaxID=1441469 RepID=A0A1Q5QC76_TALAT|nr:hypothetical protein UA08_01665 [Talaromyces atroroseus]OKL63520.1 hypothetical protein UA08_01665 [Talaromyces atroroseus]